MLFRVLVALGPATLFTCVSASLGATINVDFNNEAITYTGSGAAGGSGSQTWNGVRFPNGDGGAGSVQTTSATNLLDSTGTATTVDLAVKHTGSYSYGRNHALMSDYASINRGEPMEDLVLDFTLSQLQPGVYDLYLYGVDDTNRRTVFTVGGTSKTTAGGSTGASIGAGDYVLFAGLQVGQNGQLTGTWSAFGTEKYAAFNGLQLVAVPEPAALTLLLAGGLATLARRRA